MPNADICKNYRGAIVDLVKSIPVDRQRATQAQIDVEVLIEEGVTGPGLDAAQAAADACAQALQDDYDQLRAFMDAYQNEQNCGNPYLIPGVEGLDIPPG